MKEIIIPSTFRQLPFFEGMASLNYEHGEWKDNLKRQYFIYDVLAQETGMPRPWQSLEESISILLALWKGEREQIAQLFRERKREETRKPMVHYTGHFLSLLYWLNGGPVRSLQHMYKDMGSFLWKPVNVEERLRFIAERPAHYHSFIQLSQLYEEAEKLFQKILIMQKRTSPAT